MGCSPMVTKQYKEPGSTFHHTNQAISALVPTVQKLCLVLCAEAIYSSTPLPKEWVKSFTLQE